MTEEGAGYRSRCCAKVRPPARMCFPVDLFHNSHIFPKRRWMMTTDFVLELFEFIVMFDLFFLLHILHKTKRGGRFCQAAADPTCQSSAVETTNI